MDTKGNQVIAVDFDGTLCTPAWPGIGEAMVETIEHVKSKQAAGARILLWTNRGGQQLEEAVKWCREQGLEFDAVNENLPELIELYKNDCRKINADIYIDDKAANPLEHRRAAGLDMYENELDKKEMEGRSKHEEKANQGGAGTGL